jgi:hypothetical protein
MGPLPFVVPDQSLPESIDLSQALVNRLRSSGGMFDVVLDGRLQVVDRRRYRLRLLGEGQLAELLRAPLMPPGH